MFQPLIFSDCREQLHVSHGMINTHTYMATMRMPLGLRPPSHNYDTPYYNNYSSPYGATTVISTG